jgi:ABC-type nitrate/sulfonate/bicarbonate transport system ATPase subunit
MNSRQVAEMGVARTFQNLALFKGMSVIDNIMTGRNLQDQEQPVPAGLRIGPAEREEIRHREYVEHIIDFLEIQAFRKTPVGQLPYGLQKRVDLGRALAMEPQVLLLDEPMAGMNVEEKQDMCRFVLDVNDEFGTTIVLIEHDMGVVMDISTGWWCWTTARRSATAPPRSAQQRRRDQRLSRHQPLIKGANQMAFFLETLLRRPDGRHAVFAGGARLRADLQGLRRVQLCAGRDGAVRGAGHGPLCRVGAAMDRHQQHHGRDRAGVLMAGAVMFLVAWLIERLVLRHLVNQEGTRC